MKMTRQSRREAKELFRWCFVGGLLDEHRVRQVMRNLVESKRRGYVAVLLYFQRLVKLQRDQHTAEIESAVPLPDEVKSRINAEIERIYGPGLHMRFIHKPELIGGLRVTVGSDVYDGSVRYRLALLNKSFSMGSTSGNTRRAS